MSLITLPTGGPLVMLSATPLLPQLLETLVSYLAPPVDIMLTICAAFAINMPDITRYARDPRAVVAVQAVAIPVVITLTEVLGTVMAASSQVIYGQVLWNPLSVVELWDNRAAKFFAGLCFAFANIGTNVTGNSVPFANDLTGMFPKWINIRRGQFICAILGFGMNSCSFSTGYHLSLTTYSDMPLADRGQSGAFSCFPSRLQRVLGASSWR